MKKVRIALSMLLAALMLFTLVACNGGSPSNTGTPSTGTPSNTGTPGTGGPTGSQPPVDADEYKVIRIGITGTLGRLYGGLTPGENNNVCDAIYDTVFRVNPTTKEIFSYMLDEWGWEDETTYVMKMKPGIYFSNGKQATSEDLVYAFTSYDSRGSTLLNPYGVVWDECYARDELTAVIKVSAFYADFEYYNIFLHDKDWAEEVGWDSMDWFDPPGTGPYYVAEYVPDVRMVLKAKDDYWNKDVIGPTYVDEFRISVYPDQGTLFMNLEIGEVDMCLVGSADYSRYLRDGLNDVEINLFSIGTNWNFYFGTQNMDEMKDRRVREAIAFAVDWNQVGDNAFEDRYIQAMGIGSAAGLDFIDVGWWDYLQPDLERSKEIMEELGYGPNNKLKLHSIMMTTWEPQMETIQYYLNQSHFDLTLEFLDTATAQDLWRTPGPGVADIGITYSRRGSAAAKLRESIRYSALKSPSYIYVDDEKYQDIFNTMTYAVSPEDRTAAAHELQQYVFDELLMIPLAEVTEAYGIRTDALTMDQLKAVYCTNSVIQLGRLGLLSSWQ